MRVCVGGGGGRGGWIVCIHDGPMGAYCIAHGVREEREREMMKGWEGGGGVQQNI